VGKTTTLKRFVRRLVESGERRVFYFSFDLERDNRAIRDVVMRAKRIHPDPEGPWYIFLDEVTSIPDWQLGIKYLWDAGAIRDDLVLCTGSSARKMGTERLPGRRGEGRDYVLLPMSFRAFCESVVGLDLPGETVEVTEWLMPAGRRLARQLYLNVEALTDAVEVYARIGGFPGAVRDYLRTGRVSDRTVRMFWDVVASDIQDAGYDKHSALRLLERVGVSLGSPVAWDNLKEAMGVGSHDTVRRYAHLLSESFVLLTVFHWAMGGAFEPSRQRKLYFLDPLFARLAPTLIPGGREPEGDGLLENLVAIALYASASDRLTLADALPGAIGYWKSRDGRETDFVAPTDAGRYGSDRIPVEVKGDAKRGISAARLSMRRSFGRGVVVTRRVFDLAEIPAILIGVFLAGLAARAERSEADP